MEKQEQIQTYFIYLLIQNMDNDLMLLFIKYFTTLENNQA